MPKPVKAAEIGHSLPATDVQFAYLFKGFCYSRRMIRPVFDGGFHECLRRLMKSR